MFLVLEREDLLLELGHALVPSQPVFLRGEPVALAASVFCRLCVCGDGCGRGVDDRGGVGCGSVCVSCVSCVGVGVSVYGRVCVGGCGRVCVGMWA